MNKADPMNVKKMNEEENMPENKMENRSGKRERTRVTCAYECAALRPRAADSGNRCRVFVSEKRDKRGWGGQERARKREKRERGGREREQRE
eukprot:6209423-Pleurochrysis_carterae.AAC.1